MWVFFFFKQKTAYEMLRSLVGSEMCIRDRCSAARRVRKGIEPILGSPHRQAGSAAHGRLLDQLSLIHI